MHCTLQLNHQLGACLSEGSEVERQRETNKDSIEKREKVYIEKPVVSLF